MSPRKLSDADKSDILKLYRQQSQTTSTLANRYGVSNSTISRILKSNLLESEYEELIQQKRANRTSIGGAQLPSRPVEAAESQSATATVTPTTEQSLEIETESSVSNLSDGRRRRRRSSVTLKSDTEEKMVQTQLPLDIKSESPQQESFEDLEESPENIAQPPNSNFEELLDGNLLDLDLGEDFEEDLGEDLDEDLDEDWDDEELELPSQISLKASIGKSGTDVHVLPLSEASLPKICYLVVDRSAELIARPLKEFSDLGQIPVEEVQERTLPVFENHKVARRFSNRSQRVIKVPDAQILQKTGSHLQAKGITRLLIDGQVYSLLNT
ncbi:MAG: hypothetical protein F6K47_30910 [Symploca sp. SIO2E6]|nr:hypothetical protein [Symploca sp. SIO2E6]